MSQALTESSQIADASPRDREGFGPVERKRATTIAREIVSPKCLQSDGFRPEPTYSHPLSRAKNAVSMIYRSGNRTWGTMTPPEGVFDACRSERLCAVYAWGKFRRHGGRGAVLSFESGGKSFKRAFVSHTCQRTGTIDIASGAF